MKDAHSFEPNETLKYVYIIKKYTISTKACDINAKYQPRTSMKTKKRTENNIQYNLPGSVAFFHGFHAKGLYLLDICKQANIAKQNEGALVSYRNV